MCDRARFATPRQIFEIWSESVRFQLVPELVLQASSDLGKESSENGFSPRTAFEQLNPPHELAQHLPSNQACWNGLADLHVRISS
jgi:hypothetical protein